MPGACTALVVPRKNGRDFRLHLVPYGLSRRRCGAFSLLQGAASLTEYRFGSSRIAHMFCSHRGLFPAIQLSMRFRQPV